MAQEVFQVDAFTTERFKGNPAGVCVMEGPVDGGVDAECGGGDESFGDGVSV